MNETSHEEDLAIIATVRLGNHQAFEQIVRKYQSRIRAFCSQLLSDKTAGEDAAQETFVRAFRSLHSFRANPSFSAWLFRIARNHCIDVLRTKQRNDATSLEELVDNHGDRISVFVQSSQNLESTTEARELLQKLLDVLPADYREALLLREMYGMSYQDMAEVLHCSLDAVKARLKRARMAALQNLRHFLDQKDVSTTRGRS